MNARETAADIVLIEQLNARCTHALDGLLPESPEVFAGCCTPDGRLTVVGADGTMLADANGRAAIAQLLHRIADPAGARHWESNVMVDVDGDTARLRAYGVVVSIKTAPRTILRTTTHVDRWMRGPSGWLLAERILTLDPASMI
jgi:SnoaL-like domain